MKSFSMRKPRSLDAVVLSENFSLRYEYGLFPLRRALRVHTHFPSIMEYGIKEFLQEIKEVQADHPGMVILPGVEVAPYYNWTGSLWDDTLTMHDAQKNLLVLGLSNEDDYANLPAMGNTKSYQYGLQAALNFTPILLFLPTLWFWRRKAHRRGFSSNPRFFTKWKILGGILAGMATILLINAWPLSQPQFSPYESDLGPRPYQAVIDTVTKLNGLAIWSLIEAKDFSQHSVTPLAKVTIKTNPHPEMLLQTINYTGFGGVYQDTRTATDPGGFWDKALGQFLAGHRKNPPFTYGEIAFHTQGQAGIELDQVLTGVWVRERSTAGVVEALRTGHAYAVGQYRNTHGLRLQAFSVACGKGQPSVSSGETLIRNNPCSPKIQLSVFTTDDAAHSISIRIIRSGKVVATFKKNTPIELQFTDTQAPHEESIYYRLDIQGYGELLSNPIFLTKT